MTKQAFQIGVRYNTLRSEGKTRQEAVEMINAEFKTSLGFGSVSTYASQAKKLSESKDSHAEPEQGKRAQKLKPPDHREPEHVSLSEQIPTQLDDRIRNVAREVFREMIDELKNTATAINESDFPAEPQVVKGKGKGRRENRRYMKISLTVDETLWKLFAAEKDRLRVSSGRLMDAILWRHYGRPRLSYQESSE